MLPISLIPTPTLLTLQEARTYAVINIKHSSVVQEKVCPFSQPFPI